MARIVVIGGTGYAGGHIAAEAASRGHEVISLSRSVPEAPTAGVTYVHGSVLDRTVVDGVVAGADAVVSALAPRGDMTDQVLSALGGVASAATAAGARLGIVGGAGGSLSAPDGPRLFDMGFPEEYKHEAQVGIDSLALLDASDAALDWFFVHPAEEFGPWIAGERTGTYRIGGAVVVRDAAGKSTISGADFAIAVVDEIENPQYRRARFTVGY